MKACISAIPKAESKNTQIKRAIVWLPDLLGSTTDLYIEASRWASPLLCVFELQKLGPLPQPQSIRAPSDHHFRCLKCSLLGIGCDCAHGALRVNLCNSPAISGVLKQFPAHWPQHTPNARTLRHGHDLMGKSCIWLLPLRQFGCDGKALLGIETPKCGRIEGIEKTLLVAHQKLISHLDMRA